MTCGDVFGDTNARAWFLHTARNSDVTSPEAVTVVVLKALDQSFQTKYYVVQGWQLLRHEHSGLKVAPQ
jgi:hypothetical protein